MVSHAGPELDTDAVRAEYASAISLYKEAAHALDSHYVEVPPADFGEGFVGQGERIAEALAELHATTLDFFASRTGTWGSILALVDDVEKHDASHAQALRQVSEL